MMALMTAMFLGFSEFIGAAVSILIGVLVTFSYQGIRIDAEHRRFMKYDRFLWLRIGRWEKMSTPSYVTIVRINLSAIRTMASPMVMPEGKKGARAYKVNLVVEGEERYIHICRGSLQKMTSEALRLGRHLNLRVLDYSTHEKRWIL